MRHRRALPRHVDSMILDCIVERVDVGEKGVTCLRLVKYNPDSERTDVVDRDVTEQKAEDLAFEADTIMDCTSRSTRRSR